MSDTELAIIWTILVFIGCIAFVGLVFIINAIYELYYKIKDRNET